MYRVSEATCTGCGDCVEACPAGAVSLIDGRARIDDAICADCGSCADACPQGAIVMIDAANSAHVAIRPGARMPAIIPTATSAEATNLAHRPEIQVLAAERRRSRLWPTLGGVLVWAARELLPEVLAAWRASRADVPQSIRFKPHAFDLRTSTSRRGGHRHRWGRV
jgi:Fe-S-cluster-containing hydrogenase component 2